MLVDRDMFEHESHHAQAVLQLVESWQEHLLDDLKVAEIARWQIVHYEHDLLWHSLNLVALGTCELKHIRILLVRHDARTSGECVVELDEAEVLARIHASVEGKLCQCCCYATESLCHDAFALASSHLCIHYVIIHRVEAEQVGCHLAVERERRAITRRTSQRITIDNLISGIEHSEVIDQSLCVSTKPKAERRRHCHLEMRIAWHEHVLILLALLNEHVEKLDGETSDLLKLVAHIQFQIDQHLIVAATSAVDLLANIAQAAGEDQLHF